MVKIILQVAQIVNTEQLQQYIYIYIYIMCLCVCVCVRARARIRIPPGAWMYVCYEYCLLSGRGPCDGLITHPEESYRVWCV